MRRAILALCAFAVAGAGIPAALFAEPQFKFGFYERARHEYWKNNMDMNNDALDNRNFFRFKTSLSGQADFSKDLGLFLKLTNENKAYAYFGNSTTGNKDFHYDPNEWIFDNFYVDIKNTLGLPLDLRIGRQDFLGTYGEGFLIMDGTPQDGSRTFYFNAAKASLRADENNTVDFIYINNPRDDTYLPVLNEDKAPQALNTTDEEAYVLYWKNKSLKDLALEGYYIYKREDDDGGRGLQAQKGRINTLGSYAKYSFSPWALRAQAARQFGTYGTNDRTGLGGFVFLDRSFDELVWKPQVSLGFLYLSGDKRSTNKNEAWDPLFSRWPWMSELYLLSMGTETGITGYWTNLQMWRASLVLATSGKSKCTLWYNFLRADEQVAASTVFSSSGKDRGHLPQARFDYTFNKNVSTYFLAEYLIPGNFYVDSRDGAVFLRTEVQIKF